MSFVEKDEGGQQKKRELTWLKFIRLSNNALQVLTSAVLQELSKEKDKLKFPVSTMPDRAKGKASLHATGGITGKLVTNASKLTGLGVVQPRAGYLSSQRKRRAYHDGRPLGG